MTRRGLSVAPGVSLAVSMSLYVEGIGPPAHPRTQAQPGPEMSEPLLSASGVWVGYGKGADVLTAVDLEIRAGELCAVIGPNGSGKSTLVRALAGLLPVRRGSVRIGGVP